MNEEVVLMRERIFAIFTAKLYRALSKRGGDIGDFASKIILKALKQSAKFQLMILEIFGAKKNCCSASTDHYISSAVTLESLSSKIWKLKNDLCILNLLATTYCGGLLWTLLKTFTHVQSP